MDAARGDRHVLGEAAVAAVIPARDAQHPAVVAEVGAAVAAEVAPAAVDGGVEGDPVPRPPPGNAAAHALDGARRLVSHHQRWDAPARRPVETVDIAAADAAGPHPHEDLVLRDLGRRDLAEIEALVRGQDQRAHERCRRLFSTPRPGWRAGRAARTWRP